MTEQPSQAVQDYLKAIHRLGGADKGVPPGEIATALEVKAPSVTGLLKRLQDAGSISYTSKSRAKLTEAGVAEALRVIRRAPLVEPIPARVLRLDWSDGHAEADGIAHRHCPTRVAPL